MTRARRTALAIGVPVCLALTGWAALSMVAGIGQGNFPVNYTIPVHGGTVTAQIGGGDVRVQQGGGSQAKLTGTAHYSLIRPTITHRPTASGASFGYDCQLPTGSCGLNATITVPAGNAASVSTAGGSATVTGTTGKVTLSSGGGDLTASQTAGALTLSTDGGNINGTELRSHTVTATSGGGDVQIQFGVVPQSVQVHTDGGNITIIVPPAPGNAGYNVSAHTDGGNVNDASLDINSHSPYTITATSGGGDITIRQSP